MSPRNGGRLFRSTGGTRTSVKRSAPSYLDEQGWMLAAAADAHDHPRVLLANTAPGDAWERRTLRFETTTKDEAKALNLLWN